ncbi:MAG: methyltransferase domain-containing protein [Propionibacteriales bacterium]|nr:methyltransferase domain-containing protein [Propionibacteriales bacterium]
MSESALLGYEAALAGVPCHVIDDDARSVSIPIHRWTGAPTAEDFALIGQCRGDTLDIGCGAGRMTIALARRGHDSLGIDISPAAVRRARLHGAVARVADVFGEVPRAGRWHTVLLADGNIGIGGNPLRLLRRAASLVVPGGHLVTDLADAGVATSVRRLRLVVDGRPSRPFHWAVVGADGIQLLAATAGLRVDSIGHHQGRWSARLRLRTPRVDDTPSNRRRYQ